jgi:hypothetical protein
MRFITIILAYLSVQVTFANPAWKQIAVEDGIKVFSKEAKNGTLPFKAEAILNHSLERILHVLKDHKNKNKWAPKLKDVLVHKQHNNEYIFSEYYKTPWPSYDREFLLKGTIENVSRNQVVLKAKSISNDDLAKSSHVQANVKYINVLLKRISENETQIQFEFHGDMKGWMPIWLMNLIQKKWPLRFIQGLDKYVSKQNRPTASPLVSYKK